MMAREQMSTQTSGAVETRREQTPQTGDPECSHIVKTDGEESAAAKVLQVAQSVFDTLLDVAAR